MAGYVFSDHDKSEWNRIRRKVDSIRGPGVVNSPDSITISSAGGSVNQSGEWEFKWVLVKVVSAAAGGGKYNGRILEHATADIPDAGNLSVSELGTVPSLDNCLVLNPPEIGKSTHDLTTGTPNAQYFWGVVFHVNSNGTRVVLLTGYDWLNCS